MNREKRIPAGFALLLALLAVLLVCNLLSGSTRIPLPEALQALFHPHGAGANASVLWSIRMPRLLSAAILGGALAVSGFLLQTFFLNPIAGPYVLGVSSGAKLTVALAMILCLSRGAGWACSLSAAS